MPPFELTPLLVVSALLMLAVVVLVVLLARESGARRRLQEHERREAPLQNFEPGEVYTLLGSAAVSVDGEPRHVGLVQLEDGGQRLFLTSENVGALSVGESFSSVRGRLLRFDAGPTRTPPASDGGDSAQAVAADEEDMERTRVFSAPPAAPAVDDGFGQPFLEVTAGADVGRRFLLPAGRVRIGREAGNEVALADDGASRVHCHIAYEKGRFRLSDNNSTNGTLLNGEKTGEAWLDFDDRLQVAETEMRFSCDGFDLKDTDRARAIAAFERCLERTPDLLPALRLLAFLLERDVARRTEADPLWARIAKLEGRR